MDIDQLIALIRDIESHPDLDMVAQQIEQYIPADPALITRDMLLRVRSSLSVESDQKIILRGMLLGARLSPRGTAAALDVYGMWANRERVRAIDIDILRVAAWAYHWDGDPVGRARALVNLADTLITRDEFALAQVAATEAEQVFQHYQLVIPRQKAQIIQANIWVELQQFTQAEAIYRSLLAEYRADIQHSDVEEDFDYTHYIDTLIAYAVSCEDLNDDFASALQFYTEVEQLLSKVEFWPSCSFRFYLNRGFLEQRLGRYAEARRFFALAQEYLDQGLATSDLNLDDQYDLVQAELLLALVLNDRPYAQKMLEKLENTLLKNEQSLKQQAESQRFKALLAEQYDLVVSLMQEAVATFRKMGAHLLVLACLTELAEHAYLAGRHTDARNWIAEAQTMLIGRNLARRQLELNRLSAQYDPDLDLHERTSIAALLAEVGDYLGTAAVWRMIGNQYEQAKDTRSARAAYAHVLDAFAHARGMVRMSLHTLRVDSIYRHAAERLLLLAPDPETACAISERMRAQALLDEISNAGIWRLLDRSDLAEIRAAYEQLRYTQARVALNDRRIRRPTLQGEEAYEEAQSQRRRQVEYQQAEAIYFATLDRLATTKAAQVGWITGHPASLEQIRAALPEATLLVMLTLIAGEMWAMLLDSDGLVERVRLARKTQWQRFEKEWSQEWRLSAKEEQQKLLHELYTVGVKALEPYLRSANALIFALDDALPLYPLHAAYDGTHYLIERMPVSYIPSGTVLTLLQARQVQRPPRTKRIFLGYDAADDTGYKTLPNLSSELAHLATLVDATAQPGPLSPDELLAHLADAQMLHLSCHGEFPPHASPRFAQLIIGPQRIYADDLYRADLAVELLFLDACHSGRVGPGLQGFVGAALVAGASSVIAAMWEVEYNVARSLVRTFYQHWQTGMPCAAALRQAQLALIAQPPSLWAHFFLTGL